MYYKIENRDCKIYKELHNLRSEELLIEEQNKLDIEAKVKLKWDKFYGHSGQQCAYRVKSYKGFSFKEKEKVDLKIWKEEKVDENTIAFVPNNRTKAGREMRNFLSNLKESSFIKVWGILKLSFPEFPCRWSYPFVEICNNIIIVYIGDNQHPKDKNLIEITKKEFEHILKSVA